MNGKVIVHTKLDSFKISAMNKSIIVHDYPIIFYNNDYIEKIKTYDFKEKMIREYNLSRDKKYIGIFGFISEYKDFITAIKSIVYLPSNYELLIFGGQHPISFDSERKGLPYILRLQKYVRFLKLTERIHFMGAPASDEDMCKAMAFCDYTVLPYTEVGQSASGVASMALEWGNNVFLSRNICFTELKKYSGEAFYSFDMGNFLELSYKIKTLPMNEMIQKKTDI